MSRTTRNVPKRQQYQFHRHPRYLWKVREGWSYKKVKEQCERADIPIAAVSEMPPAQVERLYR